MRRTVRARPSTPGRPRRAQTEERNHGRHTQERRQHPLACSLTLAALASTALAAAPSQPALSKAQIAQNYGKLPLSFEANRGQSNPKVKFLSRGNGYSFFLTNHSAVLSLVKAQSQPSCHPERSEGPASPARLAPPTAPCSLGLVTGHDFNRAEKAPKINGALAPALADTIEMQLANANPGSQIAGTDQLPGHANYFLGNDPAQWHTNVPTYAKIKYANVYDGVDLVYYGNQRQLEYDFVVHPNGATKSIRVRFAGAKKLTLHENGDLEVIARNGNIAFHKPVLYQETSGRRVSVKGGFTLLGGNEAGFAVGDYDRAKPLVIDPTLSYSTYLGGSNGASYGTAVAVDGSGDAYVTGVVYATNFPATSGAYQPSSKKSASTFDAFVAEFNPTGTALLYATYLGGSGNTSVAGTLNHGDYPTGVRVDSDGAAYVSGIAYSTDFPVTSGAFQTTNKGGANGVSNCFVSKISAAGSRLAYSTYLGGSGISGYAGKASLGDTGGDGCASMAIDSSGNAYLTGTAYSTNFPVTSGAYQARNKSATAGHPNAFAAKLNPEGTALAYATYLGGSTGDGGSGIAVDSDGNAYIDGATYSTDFPVTGGAVQGTNNTSAAVGSNGFVTKFNSTGSSLVYSTYLGGSGNADGPSGNNNGDAALSIALDSANNAYVYGLTSSQDFPVTGRAFQSANNANNGSNFFVAKVNSSGTDLVYSTYLGGNGFDANAGSSGLAVDSSGDAYVTGYMTGTNFPVSSNAYESSPACAFETVGPCGHLRESCIFGNQSRWLLTPLLNLFWWNWACHRIHIGEHFVGLRRGVRPGD